MFEEDGSLFWSAVQVFFDARRVRTRGPGPRELTAQLLDREIVARRGQWFSLGHPQKSVR
jgi:hypothetical protein